MATTTYAASELATAQESPIALAPGPTRIELRPTGGANIAVVLSKAESRRLSLVLRGLAAHRPPETGYLVFFNVPAAATPGPEDLGFAGTISFFGAPTAAEGSSRNVSFQVSDVLRRLRLAGRLSNTLTLTILPTGKAAPDSQPTINQIALLEQ
jgi:hypothetical protein